MVNRAGTAPAALIRATRSALMLVQCVIFGRASGARIELLRAFDGGQDLVDRQIAVGMAVRLDPRPMHTLDPRIELVLRLGDIAPVRRIGARVGIA